MNNIESEKDIAAILLDKGFITPLQYERSLKSATVEGLPVHEAAVMLGLVTDKEVIEARAKHIGIEFADIENFEPDPVLSSIVPEYLANLFSIVPLSLEKGRLTIAMAIPHDNRTIGEISGFTGLETVPVIATRFDIEEAKRRLYGVRAPVEPENQSWSFTIMDPEIEPLPPVRWESNSSRTFAVANVEPCTKALRCVRLHEKLRRDFSGLESCNDYFNPVLPTQSSNILLQAAYFAFTGHYPLVLSPDMIWLTILQGFASHVNKNPEEMRKYFVSHAGTRELKVRRDDFCFGSFENPWEEVFEEFGEQIRSHLNAEIYNFATCRFSTTGRVERAAQEVALMDVVRSFFEFTMVCLCGIPSITLEGCTDDWIDIRKRAALLSRFGLEWWAEKLIPVLDQFVRASRGDTDLSFWQAIYQRNLTEQDSYGGPVETFSGWIGFFFPYLESGSPNPLLKGYAPSSNEYGLRISDFSPGISRVPVKCIMLDRKRYLVTSRLEFLSGLLAIEQSPQTLSLRPKIGWLIRKQTRNFI